MAHRPSQCTNQIWRGILTTMANCPRTHVTAESGRQYAIINVTNKCTIAELAAEAGVGTFTAAFYQLGAKSEDVSDKKLMIARGKDTFGRDTWLDDGSTIRSVLKVGATGKFSVSPSKLVDGMTLWIQSTSSNRGVLPDTAVVFQLPEGAASSSTPQPAAAAATKSRAPKTATRKPATVIAAPGEEEEEKETVAMVPPARKLTAASRKRKATESQEAEEAKEDEEEKDDEEKIVLPIAKKAHKGRSSPHVAASDTPAASPVAARLGFTSPSGQYYRFLPVSHKQTIDECASAIGHSEGLYEVAKKKEDISAMKELILVKVRGGEIVTILSDDYKEVRKLLKKGDGKIQLNASMVSSAVPDAVLFVQSTSGNRGLIPGTRLCVRTAAPSAGHTTTAAGTTTGKAETGKGASLSDIFARYGGAIGSTTNSALENNQPMDEDDPDDHDDGDDDDPSASPYAPLPSNQLVLPSIDWSGLIGCESENLPDMFPRESPWWAQEDKKRVYTDQVVPKRMKKPTAQLLQQLADLTSKKHAGDWISDPILERLVVSQIQAKWGHTMAYEVDGGETGSFVDASQPPIVAHAMVSKSQPGTAVLSITLNAIFKSEFGTAGQFYFVTFGPRWCLVGSVCDFPIIHTNDFCYQHTEERPSKMVKAGMDLRAPGEILAQMQKYFAMFAKNKQEYGEEE